MTSELKKLYALFPRKDRLKLLLLFAMMLLAGVLEVAGIGMIPAFVSIVQDPDRVLQYEAAQWVFGVLVIETSRDLLWVGSLALIGIFVVKNLYLVGYHWLEAKFVFNRRYHIAHRLMSSYMQAPYTFHLQRNSAELVRNTTEEIRLLANQVLVPAMKVAKEAVIVLSILVFLLVIEPLITLVVFLVLGTGTGLFLLVTNKRVRSSGKKEQQERRSMIKAVNQGIGGIKDARVLNREADFIEKFRRAVQLSSRYLAYKKFASSIPKPIVETIAVGGVMLIALIMVWQGRPMSAIVPVMTLFAMATVRLMPAIQQITRNYTMLRYNMVTVNPVYDDIMKLKREQGAFLRDRKDESRVTLNEELTAKNVWYRYPDAEGYALQGVSFSIPRGSAVAFTGSSGAGKSTVVDMLLGLLKPTEGIVYIDGTDIHEHLSAWQRTIGYIPQHIYLSDESLHHNIAFGVPEDQIDEQQVWQAVKSAQLEDMVHNLPEGLDTIVGESGTRLSGGQRQRVGIARALYHDPQVLVMDEATSALDNIIEKQIIEAIEELKGERTVIMIAHRLTTVMNCDKIYMMEQGWIVKEGTYDELMTYSEQFRSLAMKN